MYRKAPEGLQPSGQDVHEPNQHQHSINELETKENQENL